MFKFLFWLMLITVVVWNGFLGFRAYYNNWQAEDVFTFLAENKATASQTEVRNHMKKMFAVKYITSADFPVEFFDNLTIKANGTLVEISSYYLVTLWPLGMVEERDDDGSYHPDDLQGLDILRDKIRIDLEFEPYAITGASGTQVEGS